MIKTKSALRGFIKNKVGCRPPQKTNKKTKTKKVSHYVIPFFLIDMLLVWFWYGCGMVLVWYGVGMVWVWLWYGVGSFLIPSRRV
jgi:hypothetical protein